MVFSMSSPILAITSMNRFGILVNAVVVPIQLITMMMKMRRTRVERCMRVIFMTRLYREIIRQRGSATNHHVATVRCHIV